MRRHDDDISFLGKIILFFRNLWSKITKIKLFHKIKQRQMTLANYSGADSSDESKLSYTFGILKIVFIALLCVLLCFTLIFGSGIISYENVYYMFKDIQFINSYGEARADQLNYSRPMARQDITVFKNGLAVASDSEIKLFTSTGRVTMVRGSECSNPKTSASDSTLLVYDQGNRNFAIYNSFTELYREKLDYPISSAHMSDIGTYAIVTRSQKYTSVVKVYTNKNKLDIEYSKNDYVISVALSDDGKHLAVLSMSAVGGESVVVLTVVDVKSGTVKSEMTLRDVMPYGCDFASNNRIVALYSTHVAIYDTDLSLKANYDFEHSPERYAISNSGVALVFKAEGISENNLITVFDKNGATVYTGNVSGDIFDIKLVDSYVYVLTGDKVYRLDMRFGGRSESAFKNEQGRLAVFEGGEVAVCTKAAAYYITFD